MADEGLGARGGRKRQPGADGAEVAWREVIRQLKAGQSVELPVADERESEKWLQQLAKRAERHGIQVEVSGEQGVVHARRVGDITPTDRDQSPTGDRGERRARRREARAGD